MNYYIYKIICIENNKVYIGQTKNKTKRWNDHKYELRRNIHHSIHLQRAFNSYGEKSIKFEIIEICSKENVDEREMYWIDFYNSNDKNFGFNLESGGNKQKSLSLETKNKISEKNKINYLRTKEFLNSKESIQKRAKSNTGKKRSKEFKEKMSEIASVRFGEKNPFFGKEHSEETKEKISKANKGRILLSRRQKIKAINLITKEELIFESKTIASQNGFPSRFDINKVLKGELKQYKGHTFELI